MKKMKKMVKMVKMVKIGQQGSGRSTRSRRGPAKTLVAPCKSLQAMAALCARWVVGGRMRAAYDARLQPGAAGEAVGFTRPRRLSSHYLTAAAPALSWTTERTRNSLWARSCTKLPIRRRFGRWSPPPGQVSIYGKKKLRGQYSTVRPGDVRERADETLLLLTYWRGFPAPSELSRGPMADHDA